MFPDPDDSDAEMSSRVTFPIWIQGFGGENDDALSSHVAFLRHN
jgi:hypothetical protein